MQPLAEAQMAGFAVDVVAIRFGEPRLVRIRRLVEQQHGGTLGHGMPVELDVASHVARLHRRCRLMAQRLLDRGGDQGRIAKEFATLVGTFAEQLAHETDQPGGGFVAGAGEHRGVGQNFVALQPASGSVRFVDLRVEQVGHQVVEGMRRPPFDVLGDHRHRIPKDRRTDPLWSWSERKVAVVTVTDQLLRLLGDAQHIANRARGHDGAQVRDEVDPR